MKRRLIKKDIQSIDRFLIERNIKYLDIRYELLDHLATDFEENSNYGFLEDYLFNKGSFVREFAKKREKTMHLAYQKQLWTQFAKFFYKPKFIMILAIIVTIGYFMLRLFSLKSFSIICFSVLAFITFYPLFYQIKYRKVLKKVQSIQSLFSVTAFSSLFLYFFGLLEGTLTKEPLLLIIYFFVSILLGISAVIILEKNRRNILKNYNQLVNFI